jgi:predicted amidohydrolase YtcJ
LDGFKSHLPRSAALTAAIVGFFASSGIASAEDPADSVYRNGYVYTVDSKDSVQQALAVRDGRIVYVGDEAGVDAFIGATTRVVDVSGRMVMPGLIDGHMHPMNGGEALMSCNLNFAALTVPEFQQRIQACLDADPDASPDSWLMVTSWYRQAMKPEGTNPGAEALDALDTKRPITVQSSDYHTLLANSRAMELAGIDDKTPSPAGGEIIRDANGKARGLFEDHASSLIDVARPAATHKDNVARMEAALKAMSGQGVTSFLDALSFDFHLAAFAEIQQNGKLTARAFTAPFISTDYLDKPDEAVAGLQKLATQYDQGAMQPVPTVAVRHAKITMDGVLQAPAQTAGLLEPYLVNTGTEDKPDFQPGEHSGPVYWPSDKLNPMLAALAKAGIGPHLHAIGDRTVREALDGIAFMRQQPGGKDVRAAIAHAELVDPADYGRFGELDAIPVMSFQWAKPAPDSIEGARDFLGPKRFAHMEPEGSLQAAGARIAFGSDWPVDPFNEWFFLKVGVTRTNDRAMWDKYPGTLNDEEGLSRATVLRAITMNAAYQLGVENDVGSLEVGKIADFIVLDRNFMEIDAEDLGKVRAIRTVVGGKVVHDGSGLD